MQFLFLIIGILFIKTDYPVKIITIQISIFFKIVYFVLIFKSVVFDFDSGINPFSIANLVHYLKIIIFIISYNFWFIFFLDIDLLLFVNNYISTMVLGKRKKRKENEEGSIISHW